MKKGAPRHDDVVIKQDSAAPARAEHMSAMRPEDIARFFGLDVSAIRRRMSKGEFGTPFRLGRRMFVLRADFDASITRRMNSGFTGGSDVRR